MKDKIKRMAQLLFDNAEFLADELSKSDNYRNIQVEFKAFKQGRGSQEVSLRIYDEHALHETISDKRITIERIRQLCVTMNEGSGVTPLPEPVEIRETL